MKNIDLNDSRLTDYALDEMEPAQRAEFEQLIAADSAAQQTVEEIRATASELHAALASEGLPATKPAAVAAAAIIAGRDLSKLDGGPLREVPRAGAKVLRFPQLYFVLSGVAAACFAVFFVYWSQADKSKGEMRLIEVDLSSKMSTEAAPPPSVAVALPPLQEAVAQERMAGAPAGEMRDYRQKLAKAAAAKQTQEAGAGLQMRRPVAMVADSSEAIKLEKFDVTGSSLPMSVSAGQLASAPAERSHIESERASAKFNTEAYAYQAENSFLAAAENPLSTFSIDVDTASYANMRRFLTAGQRPPRDAVRIEELVNYFPYRYAPPPASRGESSAPPFAAHLEMAGAPWAPEHRLVRIGLKGREVSDAARPKANLVFLVDVSGSMNEPNKLPLVQQSMRLMLEKLRADDRVAIVVYAGASGLALPSTSVREKTTILAAIDELRPGGSTNGAAGIQLAYDIAKANFVTGGVNRVLLATDGDFNVGTTSEGDLMRLIQDKAKSGVFLSVLGFGFGNLKDATLEQLADKGNGNYAYIDTLQEAKKSLVEQAGGTLVTIAKDVKIQVEFNPALVQAYRLIGYENRMLQKEDFNNDKVDAGEIGAGHTVTALYEVVPVGVAMPESVGSVDALKYQKTVDESRAAGPAAKLRVAASGELLTVKIRYKEPAGDVSRKLEFPLRDNGQTFAEASADFKFAASVAAFGMILRESAHKGTATLAEVVAWSQAGLEQDPGGYRSEFVGLVKQTEALLPSTE